MRRSIIWFTLITVLSCTKSKEPTPCVPFSFPDAYQYPVQPGTQAWIDLGSSSARAQACMIPQEKLESMSTEGLLESLLNYPFILDYLAWDKYERGFIQLKSENLGFTELYSREDIYKVLFDWYDLMSVDCNYIYPPKISGIDIPTSMSLSTVELILYQDDFLDKLDQNELREIFKLTFKKLLSKNTHNEEYKEGEKVFSAAILGKIMCKLEYKRFIDECYNIEFLGFFIENIPNYRPSDLNVVEIITKYAKDFYSQI